MDFTNVDTSSDTSVDGMFSFCRSLTSLDVSKYKASSITNIYSFFDNYMFLTSLDVNNFDTSKVTNMGFFNIIRCILILQELYI